MINISLYLLVGIIVALLLLKPNKFSFSLLIAYWLIVTVWSFGLLPAFNFHGVAWSHQLHIQLSYHIDGLSRIFSMLISAIGVLIFLYSKIYLPNNKPKLAKLLTLLQLFALSMWLLVLTDNMIILFLAWEMTTLTSYLLIQFTMDNPQANQMAFNGMFVSVLGALTMLCGFILLHQATGTWSIQATLQQTNLSHSVYVVAFILVLVGVLTKSAQFPFHFWLPGAMQAPTPVSAYLHSATMVNAGIYLLARVHPLFAHLPAWYTSLSLFGLATMLLASVASLFQRDLKAILAYTTLFILGSMVYLLAADQIDAIEAFVFLLCFHAVYKAAAFMWVGTVDKTYGTRDIYQLAGAGKRWPLATIVLAVLMAAMAGLPPLYGFAVKEMIFEAKLSAPSISYVKMGLSIIASVFIAAASLRLFFIWWLGQADTLSAKRLRFGLLPSSLLAIVVLLLSFIEPYIHPLMSTVAGNITTSQQVLTVSNGVSSTLLALLTAALGGVVAFAMRFVPILKLPEVISAAQLFQRLVASVLKLGQWLTRLTQEQSLSKQLAIILTSLLLLMLYLCLQTQWSMPSKWVLHEQLTTTIAVLVCVAAAIYLLINKRFITSMVCLAVFGFAMSAIFIAQGAPDVAMTQLLIEILTVIILVIALQFSRVSFTKTSFLQYVMKFVIALPLAAVLMWLLFAILQKPLNLKLSHYFIDHGLPLAHGHNVVNLILVDYRALDTFGEVVVIVATALACWLLVNKHRAKQG